MGADTGKTDKGAVPDSADTPDRPRHQEADTGTLSAGQAAAALGVSEKSVRRYITSGRLPAVRVHGPKGVEYSMAAYDYRRYGRSMPYAGEQDAGEKAE